MLHSLFTLAAIGAQMCGVILLLIGCLFVASGIFSHRVGSLGKGIALILVGCYLAGLAGIVPIGGHGGYVR